MGKTERSKWAGAHESMRATSEFSMGLVEPVLVTVFERQIPILLVTRSLLLEIRLSHHVQRRGRRQLCVARRLFSRFLADPIRLTFLRSAAVLSTMRVERRHTANDKRCHC